ncbi:GNAT family N-acetyltransferase [Pseudooceanicola sp. CBS1P-1]|uniref:GNAT family N-acetyltransferase n=1 Tax=Pseudooceanicola albus TaxID=2692189 RepID=A0A6L7G6W6_9RHOB|nr:MULTISPECIES: GNAT family N-acetyltransferase [Pseudooceanicola]MBT9383129.1 GNAT family N-acetyltransferase [Pseudooceanicola endophyticus]MXN19317.1 GNAT family N-acetyltransferase [Pseudooceanicola albus]
MSLPRIEPARPRDIPGLARVLWSFTRTTPWMPRARSRAQDLALLGRLVLRGTVRLIRDEAGPCAFIAREGGQVLALYVHARARRRGLGRVLMRDAQTRADWLALWTPAASHEARRFYAAHGFATAGYGDGSGNDESLPEVLMVWQSSRPAAERRAA